LPADQANVIIGSMGATLQTMTAVNKDTMAQLKTR